MALTLSSASLSYADTSVTPMVTAAQQQTTCKGNIMDTNGDPIIGASIVVIGQKKATISDMEGNFTLPDVATGTTLTISYVGYKTQTVVWNGKDLSITLHEDAESLEDVVVVGYGTQKKVNLTGAVSVVSKKTLESRGTGIARCCTRTELHRGQRWWLIGPPYVYEHPWYGYHR